MLLRAENISHIYRNRSYSHRVLDEVSLSIDEGETVGLLGASGSGKTTLGQIVCGLLKASSGQLYYRGEKLSYPFRGQARKDIQILFQHPEVSFNPRLTVHTSMKEIFSLYGILFSRQALLERLEPFGIYDEHLDRFPAQLSGGELQRMALCRVLLAQPRLIILDEPTSMLDSITQAQIVRMLQELQRSQGLSYLFITHNRALCDFASARVYQIKEGHILTNEKEETNP